jgi:hypothetical protein
LKKVLTLFIQTNCLTELLPERALARAQYLDDYYARHKRTLGPLHGLPISVKEMVGMKGLGLNASYVAWWGKVAEEDAHVLQILWNAGAVFHARTTQPQGMMHLETDSNLYGVTVTPYNTDLSAGGSSGGEGALVAARGSCLGIGSDIGGDQIHFYFIFFCKLTFVYQAAFDVQLAITVYMASSQPHSASLPTAGRLSWPVLTPWQRS